MARIPQDDRFNKQKLGRVLKRATPKQIAWLRMAIEQEQSQRRRTTVEREASAEFDRVDKRFPLLSPTGDFGERRAA